MDDDLERALRASLHDHAGPPYNSVTLADVRASAQRRDRRRRLVVPGLVAAAVVGITSVALVVSGPRTVPPSTPGVPSNGPSSDVSVPQSPSSVPPATTTVTATTGTGAASSGARSSTVTPTG